MEKLGYRPLVSIIVPVYNIQGYVRKCIESILTQSYRRLQIVLVDDGSTDGSGEICDEYAAHDQRVLVLHSENRGQVHARKTGMNLSTGDYILNVDGDDWIEQDRVIQLVRRLQDEQPDMLYMGGYVQDFLGRNATISDDFIEQDFCGEKVADVFPLLQSPDCAFKRTFRGLLWQWCMRRELCLTALNVDETISMGEDLLGVWLCILKARSVRVFQSPTYHYVQRPKSLTWVYDPREKERMRLLEATLLGAVEASPYGKSAVVKAAAVKACFMALALSDFTMMMRGSSDYLFPFPQVGRGSRVIVYGAGKVGFHICNAITLCGGYDIVMLCDRDTRKPAVCGYMVMPPSELRAADYDFIVIAVAYEKMAREIKRSLVAEGLPEGKIALMDGSVMDEAALLRIFGNQEVNCV